MLKGHREGRKGWKASG